MSLSRASCSLKEAKAVEQKILASCKGGRLYEDRDFGATNSSIYRTERRLGQSVGGWKRPSEIDSGASLFVDGVEAGDIIQGECGDCWFLGAMSVVATRDDLLYPLFVSAHPEAGFYQIKFYIDGDWRVVTIDDRLPVKSGGQFVFAHCKDKDEFWVPLMEKAFAKINGCYQYIQSGNFSEGMTDLTGEGCESFSFKSADVRKMIQNGSFWTLLKYFEEEKFLMGCSKSGGREADAGWGILSGHAYAVLRIVEVKKSGRTVQLMQVRNPWGKKEWTGKWSDDSREWTPALMKQLGHSSADDGTFYMEFSDWSKHYDQFSVCRLLTDDIGEIWQKDIFRHSWDRSSAGGCLNNGLSAFQRNHQYWLEVKQLNTRVFLHLAQGDTRHKGQPSFSVSIGIYLFPAQNGKEKLTRREEALSTPTFINSRESSASVTLSPGIYVAMPCTFDPISGVDFFFAVYSEKPIETGRCGGGKAERIMGGGGYTPPSWLNKKGFVKDKGGSSRPKVNRSTKPRGYAKQRAAPAPPSRSTKTSSKLSPSHHGSSKSSHSPRHAKSHSPRSNPAPAVNRQKKPVKIVLKQPVHGGHHHSKPPKAKKEKKKTVHEDRMPDGRIKVTTTTITTKTSPRGSINRSTKTKVSYRGTPNNTGSSHHKKKSPNKTITINFGGNNCYKCKRDLGPGTHLKFKTRKYHPACFSCQKCGTRLGRQFYTDSFGHPACNKHAT